MYVLWSVPAFGRPAKDDLLTESGPRNWSHLLAALSSVVSFVIAGAFVWSKRKSDVPTSLYVLTIGFFIFLAGPLIGHLAYCALCVLLNKPDGVL